MDPNLNALWCRAIAEELHRAGVARAVLCPGSRNAALLFALARELSDGCVSHVDERSGAFLALGMAKRLGAPAAICVTSGTAVAECAPALAEANADGVPLIVIAADRPWELQGCGAPQVIPQRGALRAWLAEEVDLGEPVADDAALRALRARVSRAAQARGPVLIDVPLRDPLAPLPDPAFQPTGLSALAIEGRGQAPFTTVAATRSTLGGEGWPPPWLRPGMRGVICAGHGHGIDHGLIAALAETTGFPVIADAVSGLRRSDLAAVVSTGDALLAGPLADARPELAIVLGQPPLTRTAWEWLARQDCPQIQIEGSSDRDWLARAALAIPRPSAAALLALGDACRGGDGAWRARWLDADRAAGEARDAAAARLPWSESLAAWIAVNHLGYDDVHLAASMPVRHANLLMRPRPGSPLVSANRGASGIDGALGSFLGAQRIDGGGGLLLCGDLAFLHDLPALAAASGIDASAIVILNNDGGGIFDFLPVARVEEYRRWVRTPHGRDFAHAAAQFDLPYRQVRDGAALRQALDEAAAGGLTVIECDLRGLDQVAVHRGLLRAMGAR